MSRTDFKEEKAVPLKFCHQDDVTEHGARDEQRESLLRYRHLADEDREMVDCLLMGKLELYKTPRPKSKVVKIFISSTFTDMTEERNALAECAYPKLRQYCSHKYGIDFQAVDMRWGVPPEASDDHSAASLCLSELRHCQDLSIGPNFVTLIGQRYGSCPLPAAIIRSEFEAIRAHLETSAANVKLLDTCYLKDQNSLPALYRLQPASKIKDATGRKWFDVEGELRAVLYKGAERAADASELHRGSLRTLKSSVTEQEVYEGLVNVLKEKERESNCLVYIRDINGMEGDENSKLVRRFKDLNPCSSEPNHLAAKSLADLREKLKGKVPNQNMLKSTVEWETSRGIHPEKHKDYLQTVCKHFYSSVKLLIDRNMAKRNKLKDDELFTEVSQHWTIAKNRCETFVGRKQMLLAIRQYIETPSTQAFVVHGESGSGKTSLMSKAISMVNDVVVLNENEMRMAVVPRFIGTTPQSSSSHQLLYSLCHQLAYISKQHRSEVPDDYTSLKLYFRNMAQKGTFNGVVVIFLDALNQLSHANAAHSLDWLPARLAPNVKIIVSTIPERHGILERLQNKIENNFLEVLPLQHTDCKQVMRVLLEHAKKAITYPQWRLVEQAFQHCTLPLFITLTFQEAIRWTSYDELDKNTLEHTIEASIHKLFTRLEKKYGKIFVSRAFGYITAARNGLSESELEDIISLDDDVLNSLFTLWEPPVRRIPPNLWSRLYLEISSFLVEREADDIVVLSWYHMQFVNAACERYLSDESEMLIIHKNIADYYLGTWSGTKKKPFVYQPKLMSRLQKTDPHSAACRFVPDQPLIYKTGDVTERYNFRKMNQLPFSLLQTDQIEKLKKECLCNFEFLYAKLKAVSLQQMIGDFNIFVDKETCLVGDALRMSGAALKLTPSSLGAELSGRLLPHIHYYPIIHDLVRQCDLHAQTTCSLVPNCQIYSVPGGPLQYEWEIDDKIRSCVDVDVFNSPDGILMTAKPYYSKTLKIWELSQGEPRQDIQMPIGEIHPTTNGRFLNIFSKNRYVTIFKTDCGEIHADVDCGYGEVAYVDISNKYIAFTTKYGVGPCIVDIDQGKVLHKFTCRSNAVAICKTESFVVFNTDRSILLYSLPHLERKCVGKTNDEPTQIAFNKQRMKSYILTKSKLLQSVHFDIVNRVPRTSDIIENIDIQEFTISHKEHLILVRSKRCLYLINADGEKLMYTLQKMPSGVFQRTMTSFTGAGFTPNDDLIVASRDAYIAVWETRTGSPIRLLHASISVIEKIFTLDTLNKVVALLKNNTLQVWDMNNLDSDVQHANEVLSGPVGSVAVSSTTKHILCHGVRYPEAKIVDPGSGKILAVLQHSKDIWDKILACELSPLGVYGVTKAFIGDMNDYRPGIKALLTRDVIWNISTREKIDEFDTNRYVVFNTTNTIVAVVQCIFYSSVDWTNNTYKVMVIDPDAKIESDPVLSLPFQNGSPENMRSPVHSEFGIPIQSEFMCRPVVITVRNGPVLFSSFYTVLQFCEKEHHPITKVELSRKNFFKLFSRTLLDKNPKEDLLCVKDFLKHADADDQFVDVSVIEGDKLLMIYAKDMVSARFDKVEGLVLEEPSHKAAIVYDPVTATVLRHMLHIVKPDSRLDRTFISRYSSIIMDDRLRVFSNKENKLLAILKPQFANGCYKFALDGAYIVGISKDRRSVLVVRSADGEPKGQLFVHGKASCIDIAEDDRTITVGCEDGRIMILSLVLELSDPVCELVDKLPSRVPPEGHHKPLESDIEHMQQATPQLKRLAMSIKEDQEMRLKRQTSFRALATGVTAVNRLKTRSQACCIQ